MARARVKRRSDGVHQIVRRRPLGKLAMALGTALAALTVAFAAATAFTIYLLLASPLLLPAAFFLALQGWQRRARAPAPAIRFPLQRGEDGPRPSPVPGRAI